MSNQSSERRLGIDRRTFLTAASTSIAWPFLNMQIAEAADRRSRLNGYPFQLGVASGDPTSTVLSSGHVWLLTH